LETQYGTPWISLDWQVRTTIFPPVFTSHEIREFIDDTIVEALDTQRVAFAYSALSVAWLSLVRGGRSRPTVDCH